MEAIDIFNHNVQQYDRWFEENKYAYEAELQAVREHLEQLPARTQGIEIGLGTGRFALPLGIKEGVEPAAEMRALAINRGLEVMDASAERLPYKDMRFDFALMVTTLCYLSDPLKALKETHRILKPGGHLILAFIDKNSVIGKDYRENRRKSIFFRNARFYSPGKVQDLLKKSGFKNFSWNQTLFLPLDRIQGPEPVKSGYGEGSFVVVTAIKKP